MRKFCFVLLALVPVSAVCQVTIHTECPVQATRITPRVYAFRASTAGEEGWRPASKMALDLRVKNGSDRGITAMSFEITAPHRSLINEWDNVLVNTNPGEERTIYFPTDGRLIDLYGGYTSVSVILTKIRYSDGELADFNCDLGSSTIPPPFKPVKPTSPSQIYPIGGEVSPPRVLESHVMDEQNNWRGQPMSVTLSFVVEVDGSPQDIKVDSGTLGAELDQKAIETLRTWNFAPAMMGDKPVATRITIQFKFGR